MINEIDKKIEELKENNDSYLKCIECFCEIEKVIEDNSVEFQKLKEIADYEEEDDY